jgi:hypothetical protein
MKQRGKSGSIHKTGSLDSTSDSGGGSPAGRIIGEGDFHPLLMGICQGKLRWGLDKGGGDPSLGENVRVKPSL